MDGEQNGDGSIVASLEPPTEIHIDGDAELDVRYPTDDEHTAVRLVVRAAFGEVTIDLASEQVRQVVEGIPGGLPTDG